MSALRAVGIDPGYKNSAFAALDLYPAGGASLLAIRLVQTKNESGRKSGDLTEEQRRINEIGRAFIQFIDEHRPDVVVAESPSRGLMPNPRKGPGEKKFVVNAKTQRPLNLMWGTINGICLERGIHLVICDTKEIKRWAVGRSSASKAQIEKKVKETFPGFDEWPSAKTLQEHPCDATAAVLARRSDPFILLMLRRLAKEEGST